MVQISLAHQTRRRRPARRREAHIQAPAPPVREHREVLIRRVGWLRAAFVLLMAGVAVAYWAVQVVHGGSYRELAEHNRLRKLPLRAPRGLIFDRHGVLLVENVPSYDLLFDPERTPDPPRSLSWAAGILERSVPELESVAAGARALAAGSPALLAEGLSLPQVARVGVAGLEHPEFEIDAGHLRLYRHGPQTAHVLGYLGEVNERELAANGGRYRAGDLIGKAGIEGIYQEHLRGEDGEAAVVVDSFGRRREEFARRPASPGRNLRLALDLDMQQAAARYLEDKVGVALAMDPRNGEIHTLVSSPGYDPNLFARRLDREAWRRIVEDPNHPLQNRALHSTYSPGSVFKIVLAVAGLSEGVVGEADGVTCGGSGVFYGRRFRCWKRGGHGWMNLRAALKHSCDVYFYTLGQRLGIERIARYARAFGFGELTGIELGGERAGLVPDPAWSQRARGTPWYPGETISVAIGQGPLLISPLQMARMMGIVATGLKVRPHLAIGPGAVRSERVELDRRALDVVREGLWAVVNERGTGAQALVEGLEIAGKTGTVQVVEQSTWTDSKNLPAEHRDHAWFASYGPVDDPQLVVVVFVEHGGKGSAAAAPLARILYETRFPSRLTEQPAS